MLELLRRENRSIKLVIHATKREPEKIRQTAKKLNMTCSEFFRALYDAYIDELTKATPQKAIL